MCSFVIGSALLTLYLNPIHSKAGHVNKERVPFAFLYKEIMAFNVWNYNPQVKKWKVILSNLTG